MIKVALKGLLGRKLRSTLTAFAIVLGVAMVSGSLILSDTLANGLDSIYAESYGTADAVVTGKSGPGSMHGQSQAPPFPAGLAASVRKVDGVRAIHVSVQDEARLADDAGKPIGSGGLGYGIDGSADQRLNPLELAGGAWPRSEGQIAIDKATADREGLAVGNTVQAFADGPIKRYEISGIVRFGSADGIGGATLTVFDLPTGQALFGKEGKLDMIRIAADENVTQAELIRRIQPQLPATVEAKSSAEQAAADSADTQKALGFIKNFLLAFGGIALLVGGFVIANTLSITVAQRVREFATLRTLGSSRRQVLASVVVESVAVGAAASTIGLFAGLGIAAALLAAIRAGGFELPGSELVFTPGTVIASLAAGTLISLVAGLRPAIRATRIQPITAVREGASTPTAQFTRRRAITAATLFALALGAFAGGLLSAEPMTRVLGVAGGGLLLAAGLLAVGSRIARPVAHALATPSAELAGAAGAIARQNATRNPARTASTAAAMTIGIALISFVAVIGHGYRTGLASAHERLIKADYALTGEHGTVTPHAVHALAEAEGVVASEIRSGEAEIDGKPVHVAGVDEHLNGVLRLDWVAGTPSAATRLGTHRAFVTDAFARDHDLEVGSRVRLTTPAGNTLTVRIAGIIDEPTLGSPLSGITISKASFDEAFETQDTRLILVNAPGGAGQANTAALQEALAVFPGVKVQTAVELRESELAGIASMLNILYALLGISVVVSLFGLVNTLVLSVFERTRELGTLKAIGMTPRQVRRMIRHESIATSLLGATLGLTIGGALAAVTSIALVDYGIAFAIPVGTLVTFVILAIAAGMAAAVLPARRASRLNVLAALQYE